MIARIKAHLGGWIGIAGWLIMLLTICLPGRSLIGTESVVMKYFWWSIGLGFIGIAAWNRPVPKPSSWFKRHPQLMLWLFFLLACLPGVLLTINQSDGWLVWFKDVEVWLLAVLLVAVVPSHMRKNLVSVLALVCLVVLGIWGIIEWVGALEEGILTHKGTYRVMAGLGHRNLYAQFLVLVALLALPCLRMGKLVAMVTWAGLMICAFLTVVLLSRGSWILLFIAVFVLLFTNRGIPWSGGMRWLIGAVAMCSIAVLALMLDEWYTIVHHLETALDVTKGTSRDRLLLAQRSADMLIQHPVSGVGGGMWKVEIMGYDQTGMISESATRNYQRPHNDFLWVWAEFGLLAGFLYLSVFVVGLVQSWRNYRQTRSLPDLSLWLAWLAFAVVALSNFPKERMEFGLLMALLISVTHHASISEGLSRKRPWVGLGIAALAFALLVPFTKRLLSERSMERAFKAWKRGDMIDYGSMAKAAKRGGLDFDAAAFPLSWHEGEALRETGYPQLAMRLFKQAAQKNPYQPWIAHSMGLCFMEEGNVDSAMVAFYKAVEHTPRFQQAWLDIAEVQCQRGDLSQAVASFLKANALEPNAQYDLLGAVLGGDTLTSLIPMYPERKLMLTVTAIRNTPSWSLSVMRKTALNDLPLPKQVLIDACYYMLKNCRGEEDCAQCNAIKDKYIPGEVLE